MHVFVSITPPGPYGGVLRPMMNVFSSSGVAKAVAVVSRITRILYILQTKLLLERVSTRYTDRRDEREPEREGEEA